MDTEVEKYARVDIKTTVDLTNVALVNNLIHYGWSFNITKNNSLKSIIPKITISQSDCYSDFYTEKTGFFQVIPKFTDSKNLPARYEDNERFDFCRYPNKFKIYKEDLTLVILLPALITYKENIELSGNNLIIDGEPYTVDIDTLAYNVLKLKEQYSDDDFRNIFKEVDERELTLVKLKEPRPPRRKL